MKNNFFTLWILLICVSSSLNAQLSSIQAKNHEQFSTDLNIKYAINFNYNNAAIGKKYIYMSDKYSYIFELLQSNILFAIDKNTLSRSAYYVIPYEWKKSRITNIVYDSISNKVYSIHLEKNQSEVDVVLQAFSEKLELISKKIIFKTNNIANNLYLFTNGKNILVVLPDLNNDKTKECQIRYAVFDNDLNKIQANTISVPLTSKGKNYDTPDFDFLNTNFDNKGYFYGLIYAFQNERKDNIAFPIIVKIDITNNNYKLISLENKKYSLEPTYMSKIKNNKITVLGLSTEINEKGKLENWQRLFLTQINIETEKMEEFKIFKITPDMISTDDIKYTTFVNTRINKDEAFIAYRDIFSESQGKSKIYYFSYWHYNEIGDRIIMSSWDFDGGLALISFKDSKIEYIKLHQCYYSNVYIPLFIKFSTFDFNNSLYAFHLIPYDLKKYKVAFDDNNINEENIMQAIKYFKIDPATGNIEARAKLFIENEYALNLSLEEKNNTITFDPFDKTFFLRLMTYKNKSIKLVPAKSNALSDPAMPKDSYLGKFKLIK